MENIPVAMARENLDNIPDYPLPAGYKFRFFRRGEELIWAQIQVDVGAFESVEKAMERFNTEFAPHLDEFERRCIFLVEESTDRVIGTTTAWYHPDRKDDGRGRIHWVAIIPGIRAANLQSRCLPRLCAFSLAITTKCTSGAGLQPKKQSTCIWISGLFRQMCQKGLKMLGCLS